MTPAVRVEPTVDVVQEIRGGDRCAVRVDRDQDRAQGYPDVHDDAGEQESRKTVLADRHHLELDIPLRRRPGRGGTRAPAACPFRQSYARTAAPRLTTRLFVEHEGDQHVHLVLVDLSLSHPRVLLFDPETADVADGLVDCPKQHTSEVKIPGS